MYVYSIECSLFGQGLSTTKQAPKSTGHIKYYTHRLLIYTRNHNLLVYIHIWYGSVAEH